MAVDVRNYEQIMRRSLNFALPTVNDVRPVDPVVTDLSIGFKNPNFVWDELAPPVPVDEKSGTYFRYTRDYWFRDHGEAGGTKRAAESVYKRVGMGVETGTYETDEYGLEKGTGRVTAAASQTPDGLGPLTTQYLTHWVNLQLERLVAADLFITGVWGTSSTLSGTDQWSDFANSDPIADAQTASNTVRRNTGAEPNKLFVGAITWNKLKEHPLILDKYKHTQTGILSPELVADALFDNGGSLTVGKTVYNTAAEGVTFSGADVWTDNALFLVQNAPGLQVANGAYTFVWREGGVISGAPPWAFNTYMENQSRSEIQQVWTHPDPNVVSAQHGYIYLDTNA